MKNEKQNQFSLCLGSLLPRGSLFFFLLRRRDMRQNSSYVIFCAVITGQKQSRITKKYDTGPRHYSPAWRDSGGVNIWYVLRCTVYSVLTDSLCLFGLHSGKLVSLHGLSSSTHKHRCFRLIIGFVSIDHTLMWSKVCLTGHNSTPQFGVSESESKSSTKRRAIS